MTLTKALKAHLTRELHIDLGTHPISIAMEGDAILMEGTVDRVATKKRALLIAMGMEGASGVVDRLRVKPASPMGDGEIRDHITNALCEEASIEASSITLEVDDGVVDIEGTVGSLSHKRLCGVLAWWVPGTRDVINSLEVVPPEEDSPDEIADALRIVLEKDRTVDSSSISVSIRGWDVTLSGTVKSTVQRDAAEDDAWYVWGVNNVTNTIQVSS